MAGTETRQRIVRVFLSSTFRDFIAERDVLVKRVFPELRKFCRDRFVELVEVDLRWGITAEQAERGEVLPICLKEITRCRPAGEGDVDRPYFVGMLGERYGWVPDPDGKTYTAELLDEQPWLREHMGGVSVTELEILHGVLRNEAMVGRAFFYLRDPAHAAAIQGPARADFLSDKPEEQAKLARLKEAIRARSADFIVREGYPDPAALGELLLADLREAVARAFPLDQVPDSHARESLDHQVFQESRTRAYVSIEGLFDRLDAFLQLPEPGEPRADRDPGGDEEEGSKGPEGRDNEVHSRLLVVRGESGGGKSALLAAWFSRLGELASDPASTAFPVPGFRFIHFIGGTPTSTRVDSMLRRLLEEILRAGAAPTGARVAADLAGMREQLPLWLQGLSARGGGLLVLDALNQLSDPVERELGWWPEKWPANILIVASVLPGDALRAMDHRGWITEDNTLTVQPLTADQRRKVALEYLALFKKSLEPRLLDRLLSAEQTRNPLFLRTVLEELRVRSSHDDLEARLDDMLQSAAPPELFVRVLRNLEHDFERPDGSALVHRLFEVMGQARRGLSESELLQLLSLARRPVEEPVPRGLLAPVFLALEDSLVSRDGQLSFFHDYLRQAVEREYLDEEREQVESNAILAGPLVRWREQAFGSSLAQYGHQHGIHHLLARLQGPLAPLLRPENLDQALALLLDRECREAGAEALASPSPFAESLEVVREALARERPAELATGVELTLLALGEPTRLKRHLLSKLDESARVGDWTTVARLADAEPDTDGKLLAALRALRYAKAPLDGEWLAKMDRLAGETSCAEDWRQLLGFTKL